MISRKRYKVKFIKKPTKKYDTFRLQLPKLHQCYHAKFNQRTQKFGLFKCWMSKNEEEKRFLCENNSSRTVSDDGWADGVGQVD